MDILRAPTYASTARRNSDTFAFVAEEADVIFPSWHVMTSFLFETPGNIRGRENLGVYIPRLIRASRATLSEGGARQ